MIYLYLIFLSSILYIAIKNIYFAPWVPTRMADCKLLADSLKTVDFKEFVEIGAGTGRVSFYLAKRFPQQQFTVIEINYLLTTYMLIKKIITKQRNIHIVTNDLYKMNFNKFDVCYLFAVERNINNHLKTILTSFKNKLIISYIFPIKYLNEVNKKNLLSNSKLEMYFYQT